MADIQNYKCDRCGEVVDYSWYDIDKRPAYKLARRLGTRPLLYDYKVVQLCPNCTEKLEAWLNTPEKKYKYTVEVWFKPKRGRFYNKATYYSVPAENALEAETYIESVIKENNAYRGRKIVGMAATKEETTDDA